MLFLLTTKVITIQQSHKIQQKGKHEDVIYFADWTHGLSWKQLLKNNPGIIHLLQHWRYHYQTTTVGTAFPYKSQRLHMH